MFLSLFATLCKVDGVVLPPILCCESPNCNSLIGSFSRNVFPLIQSVLAGGWNLFAWNYRLRLPEFPVSGRRSGLDFDRVKLKFNPQLQSERQREKRKSIYFAIKWKSNQHSFSFSFLVLIWLKYILLMELPNLNWIARISGNSQNNEIFSSKRILM